jgi:hypothetical protein
MANTELRVEGADTSVQFLATGILGPRLEMWVDGEHAQIVHGADGDLRALAVQILAEAPVLPRADEPEMPEPVPLPEPSEPIVLTKDEESDSPAK